MPAPDRNERLPKPYTNPEIAHHNRVEVLGRRYAEPDAREPDRGGANLPARRDPSPSPAVRDKYRIERFRPEPEAQQSSSSIDWYVPDHGPVFDDLEDASAMARRGYFQGAAATVISGIAARADERFHAHATRRVEARNKLRAAVEGGYVDSAKRRADAFEHLAREAEARVRIAKAHAEIDAYSGRRPIVGPEASGPALSAYISDEEITREAARMSHLLAAYERTWKESDLDAYRQRGKELVAKYGILQAQEIDAKVREMHGA